MIRFFITWNFFEGEGRGWNGSLLHNLLWKKLFLKYTENLTHFNPIFHFYTPWKCQKPFGYLRFSGVVKMKHWSKIGLSLEVLYAKFQATRLQLIILDISKPFENNFWELLEYEKKIVECIWCHNINPAYETNLILLLNFFTTLRECCGNATTWP